MEAFDETFAINTGLKTLFTGKAIRAAVDKAVLDMTHLRWETMQLANLWVLRRIQSGQVIPRLTQSVFYQAMQLVSASSSGRTPAKPVEGLLEALEELYKPERAATHMASRHTRTQLLKADARALAVNASMRAKLV